MAMQVQCTYDFADVVSSTRTGAIDMAGAPCSKELKRSKIFYRCSSVREESHRRDMCDANAIHQYSNTNVVVRDRTGRKERVYCSFTMNTFYSKPILTGQYGASVNIIIRPMKH